MKWNLLILHNENIRCGALTDFAPFIQHDYFVEALAMGFARGPNAIQPGNCLHAGKRRGRMPSMLANRKLHRVRIFWQIGGCDDQIDFGHFFFAFPHAGTIPDEVDSGAALVYLVGPDDFLQIDADFAPE